MTDHPESSPEPSRGATSCEVPDASVRDDRRHRRFDPATFSWDGVSPQVYKLGGGSAPGTGWRDVLRHTLIGGAGEPMRFQLRYFEIAPRGYSSLEKHAHAHSVVVLRGKGRVVVGYEVFEVEPFDLIYVPPGTPHQFVTAGEEPLGFLCPVDADRDPPQPLTEHELQDLTSDPRVRDAIRIETPAGVATRE